MKRFLAPLAAALLALPALTAPALAAEPAAAPLPSDPYTGLVQAIVDGVDENVLFNSAVKQIRDALVNESPNIAALEGQYPGTVDAMIQAMAPTLRHHSSRLSSAYQKDLAALLASNLTAEEARDAAAFYSSPLGRKLMGKVQDNYTVGAVASEVVANEGEAQTSAAAVERDIRRTTAATMRSLTPEDHKAINAQLLGKVWVLKLQAIQPKMHQLRAAMENAALSPEDDAAMTKAVEAVLHERIKQEN